MPAPLRVCIVGAGISGLAAARSLKSAGHHAIIFEKANRVGGRVATRKIGDYVFDPGASSIAPRGHAIEQVMLDQLDTSDLIRIETPIYIHQGLRPSPMEGAKAVTRYTYGAGNNQLAKMMAEGLDIRPNTQVESIEKTTVGYRVLGEEFDAVILTAPIPQTAVVLWTLGESRPFANSRYRPCLSVMLGFAKLPPTVKYHALLEPEQRHPLMWLSLESLKSPGRAPEGKTAMVAQMSPAYSLKNFSATSERIIGDVLDYIARLYGDNWNQPEVADVKRWKYSQPESVSLFETVNDPKQRIIVAGDGVLAGRVENAYDSGVKAAALLTGSTALEAAV